MPRKHTPQANSTSVILAGAWVRLCARAASSRCLALRMRNHSTHLAMRKPTLTCCCLQEGTRSSIRVMPTPKTLYVGCRRERTSLEGIVRRQRHPAKLRPAVNIRCRQVANQELCPAPWQKARMRRRRGGQRAAKAKRCVAVVALLVAGHRGGGSSSVGGEETMPAVPTTTMGKSRRASAEPPKSPGGLRVADSHGPSTAPIPHPTPPLPLSVAIAMST
mmetsp:Transcript_21074/g.45238  ORF Transcript_21074/g.45238 Transcript_21074/m.45238 type:complete len:219 (-) Transcript_21074:263-919(-)